MLGSGGRRVGVVGGPTLGNVALVQGLTDTGVTAVLVDPLAAADMLETGDMAIGRLDVLPTLDGVEAGLDALLELELGGIRLLNCPGALLRAHDKLLTALVLARAGVPHPATEHLLDPGAPLRLEAPLVLKPRFGSWGADVFRCDTKREARRLLFELSSRPWFRSQGVLVQELVAAEPRDVRLVVAGGHVVGAVERRAAAGEWRTNVSVGASRRPVEPTVVERRLALDAAAALAIDLVGVDILHGEREDVVIELNGAVEFDASYSLTGHDVYDDIVRALALAPLLEPAGI